MQIYSIIYDHRIEAANALAELSFEEYLDISKGILKKNEFQRKKVVKGTMPEIPAE